MGKAGQRPFALPAEQQELLARATQAGQRLEHLAAEHPRGVNRPLLSALAQEGLLPRLFPAGLGGSNAAGISALDLCVLREGLARSCTEAETALALQGLGSYPIVQSAGPEVARRWIPEVATGRAVAAFALTEPGAGSDAAALELRAAGDGDGWRLSGEKKWISNAPDADVYVVFARTGEPGSRGVSAFAVEGGAPGLDGRRLDLAAGHAIGALTFDGVRVEPEARLGDEGEGFKVAMRTLDLFRPSVGAFAVGMAAAALEAAVQHAGARRAFGRALREFQAVSHRVAEMATRVEAARLLVYAAAAAYDAGDRPVRSSAMAKLYATEVAQQAIDAAIQVHGAAALERGHLLERLYREVRATRIYEGASEIQREVIARELFR